MVWKNLNTADWTLWFIQWWPNKQKIHKVNWNGPANVVSNDLFQANVEFLGFVLNVKTYTTTLTENIYSWRFFRSQHRFWNNYLRSQDFLHTKPYNLSSAKDEPSKQSLTITLAHLPTLRRDPRSSLHCSKGRSLSW